MKLKAFMRKLTSILLAVLSAMCLTGMCYAEETTTATVPTADVTAETVERAGTETLYKGTGSIGRNQYDARKDYGSSWNFLAVWYGRGE